MIPLILIVHPVTTIRESFKNKYELEGCFVFEAECGNEVLSLQLRLIR